MISKLVLGYGMQLWPSRFFQRWLICSTFTRDNAAKIGELFDVLDLFFSDAEVGVISLVHSQALCLSDVDMMFKPVRLQMFLSCSQASVSCRRAVGTIVPRHLHNLCLRGASTVTIGFHLLVLFFPS